MFFFIHVKSLESFPSCPLHVLVTQFHWCKCHDAIFGYFWNIFGTGFRTGGLAIALFSRHVFIYIIAERAYILTKKTVHP